MAFIWKPNVLLCLKATAYGIWSALVTNSGLTWWLHSNFCEWITLCITLKGLFLFHILLQTLKVNIQKWWTNKYTEEPTEIWRNWTRSKWFMCAWEYIRPISLDDERIFWYRVLTTRILREILNRVAATRYPTLYPVPADPTRFTAPVHIYAK